ncbi:MAG: phage tail tape measure protein [Bacteroides sp.]|nr:phage tail tape measure protein [Bacteroides sp.]
MANYTTQANVILSVNGRQAQKMLSTLEKDAKRLESQLTKAALAGDKATMKKLQRELNATNRMIDQLKGSAKSAEQVLKSLDKATPKELQRTLKTLQQQLNGIQRGTPAWNAHIAKIQAVKAEISKLNTQMAVTKTVGERCLDFFNKWQVAIMGAVAAITGIVMAARKAVSAYAEMDEAMANTRKFTGMTQEQVEDLNEAFRKMDTRTPRETLNELAQEAGRLGKSTKEDVLGYVQAADIINVALSDLGEGATQSIAKLSNIFKLEDQYGTYDSMVKIGSVVNVLSQNCTASKPYLVEFANRLAGVGNQAHLSLQNIIGFGAVLDANAQKVEASATAIGQVLTRMYRDPAKYAKVAGLDVKEFTELLKTDANEALLTFLETLGKAGDLDVLSPMFKDMGENGARVITALSTLSKHIDEVRWQQENANKAFDEGTSVLHEYEIFNNTAQASIDKARKRVTELAIELGQKLYPLMKYITSSGTLMLRAINAVVDFLIRNKREIVSVMWALAAYTVVVNANKAAHLAWAAVVKVVNVVAVTVKATLIGLRAVYYTLTNQIRKAEVATKAFNSTTKRSLWGVIAAAIALVVAQLIQYIEKMKDAGEEAERIRKENEEWKKSLEDIEEASSEYAKNEVSRLDSLYQAATNEANSKEKRIAAAEALQRLYPDYFKNLSTEAIMVGEAKVQYDKLRQSIIDVARAKAAAELIQANEAELLKLEDQRDAAQTQVNDRKRLKEAADKKTRELHEKYDKEIQGAALGDSREMKSNNIQNKIGQINRAADASREADRNLRDAQTNLDNINSKIDSVNAANQRLAKKYNISIETMVNGVPDVEEPETPRGYTHVETDAEKKKRLAEQRKAEAEARRAAIKAKKEFKESLESMKGVWEKAYADNLALYSQGKLTYCEYLDANRHADEEYFDDRIALFEQLGLQEDEDYAKLLKQKEEMASKWIDTLRQMDIHEIQRTQKKDEAQLTMQYNDPTSEMYQKELALQEGLHRIRVKALEDTQKLYNQGSKEWAEYQEQIEDEEAAYALEKQRAYAAKIAEWRENYAYESASKRKQIELDMLEEIHNAKLISDEEYLRAKKDLDEKYKKEAVGDIVTDSPQKQLADRITQLKSFYAQGIIDKATFERAKNALEQEYHEKSIERAKRLGNEYSNNIIDIYESFRNLFSKSDKEGQNWATKLGAVAQALYATMSSGLQQYSEYASACADLEIAKAEKKYDREIELAEGNSYKVKKAEKQKEQEIAKIKSDAAKKQFAMQVIQAVAQTATNALNAYGSAAAVPVIGYILAPIAAAMAVAAGAMQIATIKKQQQASEAQGYMTGGFTPEGKPDEVAGVVHKGEWVASQRLVNNPRTRPLLEALDYAQRTNTIGSITAADVSRTITAPAVLASAQSNAPTVVNNTYNSAPAPDNERMVAVLDRLDERLNEPFVTVNTVTGEHGIQRAQEEYDRLMKNKSPKSKK